MTLEYLTERSCKNCKHWDVGDVPMGVTDYGECLKGEEETIELIGSTRFPDDRTRNASFFVHFHQAKRCVLYEVRS